MKIIDENKFNNEVYDDVQYINNCRSLRMRLLIVEKIIVIFLAMISVLVGFLILSTFINSIIQLVNNFTNSYNLFLSILISVLEFLALLIVLFVTKRFSFYKDTPQNFAINLALSFGIFLFCSAFTIIGPFAVLSRETKEYPSEALDGLMITQGLSGEYQANGILDTTFDQMIKIDLDYIQNKISFSHDMPYLQNCLCSNHG